ncbi:hypothetical protein GTA08_BOTSDO10329 [Botryosphaeria dothidea]|uniref:Ring finger domain protein n=1 Tax=Botryosphaeria dothidea TaxID=55169 RepID=A0A8H4IL47_9PEZI|nr:hypothetical protein GTA08_BOTSDO10329 [Botryosphaeria dothidea]
MTGTLDGQGLFALLRRDAHSSNHAPAEIPMAGRIVSMLLSLVALCIISVCFLRRVQNIRSWSSLPLGSMLIIGIYLDSFLFVFITAVFKDVGLNESVSICRVAILLCLTLYLSTKVCVYLFLVEKAYIVRGSNIPRLKDKLHMFNICAAMGPYGVLAILNIIWRFSHVKDGTCIIGMEKKALMPLIIFDVAVNVYLTALFIVPLRRLYSYKNKDNNVRTMAFRTFIGSCATLTSSVANLTLLMLLDGEPAWICFITCNAEILFSVLVLHWVTSRDRTSQTTYANTSSRDPAASGSRGGPSNASNALGSRSRSTPSKSNMGMETIISEHYQAHGWPSDDDDDLPTGAAAAQGVGTIGSRDWPADTRCVINSSCARGDGAAHDGDIALDRILVRTESEVTREERRVAGGRRAAGLSMASSRVPEDGESDTTAASRGREGSTDGIVGAHVL